MHGRLTVIADAGKINGRWQWLCRCACGGTKIIAGSNLLRVFSCGCLQQETRKENGARSRKHGRHGSKEYKAWRDMWSRCSNPNMAAFKNYGGRGITVCDAWRQFENFFADMGPCPPGLEIDRINNDGNYEPSNCHWCSRSENARNRRERQRDSRGRYAGSAPILAL